MFRALLSKAVIAVTGAAAFGCASSQPISLACIPKNVSVYVDGRLIDGAPEAVKLAKDEPHAIFLKGGGYQSQMLVFESRERDGEPELEPADLCSRVKFIEMQPEVKIELDPGADPAP